MPFWTSMGGMPCKRGYAGCWTNVLEQTELEGLHQEQHGGGQLGVSSESSPHQGC